MRTNLVQLQHFIQATRDSGYKSTASALAELVDNAIEAGAKRIKVEFQIHDNEYEVSVIDNGSGMNEKYLSLALQFGGSSRFNERQNMGRYGMGLPNSSLSQCRRIEVTTWRNKKNILFNYLDVDEVVENNSSFLPKIRTLTKPPDYVKTKSGTFIKWRKCDRLSFKYIKSLQKHLHFEMGRIFRYPILGGVEIYIGNDIVKPFDPLFLSNGSNITGGRQFGKILKYEVKIPGTHRTSEVAIKFIELPVELWANFTNEEKRKQQITKRAGVSIIRAQREIDYGWFFMGDKRKENYDDWWRCEISFHPDLDEIFGVTHTKQEIRETENLINIISPDLEQVARVLNNRVRLKFIELKKVAPSVHAKEQMQRNDVYLAPVQNQKFTKHFAFRKNGVHGMEYQILVKHLDIDVFYDVKQKDHNVILTINKNHIFYDKVYLALQEQKITKSSDFMRILEILLFAIARSELQYVGGKDLTTITRFKKAWSSNIKGFIG